MGSKHVKIAPARIVPNASARFSFRCTMRSAMQARGAAIAVCLVSKANAKTIAGKYHARGKDVNKYNPSRLKKTAQKSTRKIGSQSQVCGRQRYKAPSNKPIFH